jgi:hypothetical protein
MLGGSPALRPTQLREQRLRGDHPNAAMLPNGEHVPVIAGDEGIHSRLNRTGEDEVIVRIARHGLGRGLRRRNQLGRKVDEKLLDPSPALRRKAQLPGEDSLQLHHHRLGQDKLQASRDERGD